MAANSQNEMDDDSWAKFMDLPPNIKNDNPKKKDVSKQNSTDKNPTDKNPTSSMISEGSAQQTNGQQKQQQQGEQNQGQVLQNQSPGHLGQKNQGQGEENQGQGEQNQGQGQLGQQNQSQGQRQLNYGTYGQGQLSQYQPGQFWQVQKGNQVKPSIQQMQPRPQVIVLPRELAGQLHQSHGQIQVGNLRPGIQGQRLPFRLVPVPAGRGGQPILQHQGVRLAGQNLIDLNFDQVGQQPGQQQDPLFFEQHIPPIAQGQPGHPQHLDRSQQGPAAVNQDAPGDRFQAPPDRGVPPLPQRLNQRLTRQNFINPPFDQVGQPGQHQDPPVFDQPMHHMIQGQPGPGVNPFVIHQNRFMRFLYRLSAAPYFYGQRRGRGRGVARGALPRGGLAHDFQPLNNYFVNGQLEVVADQDQQAAEQEQYPDPDARA